jgi:D-lactate dehydrogenase (cytochrome)
MGENAMQARIEASEIAPVLEQLRARFGDRFSTTPAVLARHGQDESYHTPMPPDGVVFANSTEEVAEVVRLCAAHHVPVIPFGTGTSLEGHIGALSGGICIDLSNMNKILEVNAEDLDCRVQAGVTRKQLNTHLRDQGLFFPIDPGADASIGGMAATRASGTNAVRYGTMRENVLSLTVVTAAGEIIRTAQRARKSSAGYDLTRLFVGSEGTLGVITEVALKLYGIPEATSAAVCQFGDLESAINTVILTIQSGIPMARIELLNDSQMEACIRFSGLEGYEKKPTLFFEFHGSETGVKEQAEAVEAIAGEFGGSAFQWAEKAEDRNKLWEARHNVHYAIKSMRPDCEVMATDICVPISRLAEAILEAEKDLAATGLKAGIVGHVGDGNFHVGYCIDPKNKAEVEAAKGHNERMVMRAIAAGGTCTGEHGVGQGKIRYMEAEHGAALGAMKAIKQALDPQNIMNPGKILPA